MSYQITAHEMNVARRDNPNSAIKTWRTLAIRTTRSDAIETARSLLNTHTEVTIWNNNPGSGMIIERWLPGKTIILSVPRLIGTTSAVTSWLANDSAHSAMRRETLGNLPSPAPRLVDRHFYEYTASDGRKVNVAFETCLNQAPQVPKFGTQVAIERVLRQWQI